MWGEKQPKQNLERKKKRKEKQHIIKLILQSYYKLANERLIA